MSLLVVLAAAAFSAWSPVSRRVAVVYHPNDVPGGSGLYFYHPAHQRAELVLNHLGMDVEPYDASRPLPDPAGLRGVLVWPPAARWAEDPRRLCRWLNDAMRRGVRVALVGGLGLHSTGDPDYRLAADCAETYRLLGVESKGLRVVDGLSVSSMTLDRSLVGFERRPDATEAGVVPVVTALPGAASKARLHLSEGDPAATDLVVLSARGGVALDPLWLYSNQEIEPHRLAWVADPFAFFEAAFALRGLPRPDVTTLNGRRILMARVDGDGFFNVSELDRKKTSGQVFHEEVISKRPGIPFSVSLIAGYYDMALYDDEKSIDLSRRVLTAPNVEPASHGYAHPLVWATGKLALRVPRYSMDPAKEIAGSAALLRERLLLNKKLELFFWTGDCLPGEAELRLAEEAGLVAMNGGGGRFDALHASYAHLFPLGRRVGSARQLYAAVSNENDFTNLWGGPFYGYRDVIETFERSGSPRRIKPVDVYVHFYSAERFASLGALNKVLDWAQAQPLIAVHGGRWARTARDFFAMRISRDGSRFLLEDGAAVRTVRFDGERRVPDLRRSKGVLGWKREGSALYVHLDGSARREVALGQEVPGPRLEEANFEIDDWRAEGAGVRFKARGWGAPKAVLAGLVPGRLYEVNGRRAAADAHGRLALPLQRSVGEVVVR